MTMKLLEWKYCCPPCDIIAIGVSSGQDKGFIIRNPTCSIRTMFKCKCCTTWKEEIISAKSAKFGIEAYLAQSLHRALFQLYPNRPEAQWSWEERVVSRLCAPFAPHCNCLFIERLYGKAPHAVEQKPACGAWKPGDTRVKIETNSISPTDNQPPSRQEGDTVVLPSLRQVRDGAGEGERAREQLHIWDCDRVANIAAHHHLPWCRGLLLHWIISITNQYDEWWSSQLDSFAHGQWGD